MSQRQLSHLFLTPDFYKKVGNGLSYYHQPIESLDVLGFSAFYGLQLAIWQLRSLDLQKQYPLDSLLGRIGFFAWCTVHGRNEYIGLQELTVFWQNLAQPAEITATPYSAGITRLMQLVALSRTDLQLDYRLSTETKQIALLRWFCLNGWAELHLTVDDITSSQKALFETTLANGFKFIEVFIYTVRADLQSEFNLGTEQGQLDYRQWLTSHGSQETILSLLQATDNKKQQATELVAQNEMGVNLIGYAFGELGIGEDVRMAALALKAANIPFTVINFRPGDDIRQNDRSIEQWVTEQAVYAVNIVCLTALEHLRLYAEQGETLFKNRYTIGYWPWELKKWPANWRHCFSLVDEVWASSKHIQQAAEKAGRVPVYLMPMAVAIPKVKRYIRKQWSLPEADYLFVFSFDGNSSIARKNPLGVIEAFKLAFPDQNEAVGLVIKCMRPDSKNLVWQSILSLAKQDPRIHIIDRMLEKPEVLGLYKLCDCFVSLHRAEGFGRGIAEALLLGLKVIATDHGGNIDFCLPGSAYLVPYKLISVGKKNYVEASGQKWANPDITSSAKVMKNLAKSTQKAKKTVLAPIKKLFLPNTIGTNYKKRLDFIFTYFKETLI
jgi:glycosyltransferase involved in cell wall biosynthesis